jgi:hypothetical protein
MSQHTHRGVMCSAPLLTVILRPVDLEQISIE